MLSSDMVALEADATMMGRLQTMKRHVEAGRPEDLAHVQTLAAAEPAGALRRILDSGCEVSSVSVEAAASTVVAVSGIRSVLDSNMERAVFGAKAVEPADRVIRALRWVRLRRYTRLSGVMRHIIDKDDCGTSKEPFLQFGKMALAAAIADFTAIFQRFQSACLFCSPASSANAVQFVGELQRQCVDAVNVGVSWAHTGEYYLATIRRADKLGPAGSPEPLDYRWASDPTNEWVALLNQRKEAARAEAAASATRESEFKRMTDELFKKFKISGKRVQIDDDALNLNTLAGPRKKQRSRTGAVDTTSGLDAARAAKKAADKQRQQQQQQQRGNSSSGDEQKAKREQMQQQLTAKLGMKDGKPPCYFHHRPNGTCRYDAGECRLGYHGAKSA